MDRNNRNKRGKLTPTDLPTDNYYNNNPMEHAGATPPKHDTTLSTEHFGDDVDDPRQTTL